jgi:Ca2+/H+ antiporter, TMEM165/GDT1 family
MEWKIFLTAFLTIFLAELGDKTQLAAITMTAKSNAPLAVFLGASLGLILVTTLAVFFGTFVTQYVPADLLQKIVAIAFIVIGVLMLFKIL